MHTRSVIRRLRATSILGATLVLALAGDVVVAQSTAPELPPDASVTGVESIVRFTGHGGVELQGTLRVPPHEDGDRLPAVLLLPGSGPTDRDGNQPPMIRTDLLRDLAEDLAIAGVVTLRFDKRACQRYIANWPKDIDALREYFAWDRFTGDAAAAYEVLRERSETDAARVAILGHSEGGLIALQIVHDLAGTEAEPPAIVLLGTAGRTLDKLIPEQFERSLTVAGAQQEMIRSTLTALEGAIDAVLEQRPIPDDLPFSLRALFHPTTTALLYAYFTVDPAELAGSYAGDVLIINGANDVQVIAERDAPRLLGAFAGRPAGGTVEVLIPPGTSHNMKVVQSDAEPGFTGPVQPVVVRAIDEFIDRSLVRRALPDAVTPADAEETGP